MLTKRMQSTIGTGYLPDMPTLLDSAKISQATPNARKTDSTAFHYLKQHTSDQISLVSEVDARHGLFFKPKKLDQHTVLFPELRLAPNSVHAALGNPAGATIAQGKENANVIIDTEGFLHAAASLHADDDINVKATRGALFETTTYDAMAVTQNMFASTHRSGIFGGSRTEYHKVTEWSQIKKAREPMLITTTRGDFIADLTDSYFEHSIRKFCHDEVIRAARINISPLEPHEVCLTTSSSSGFKMFAPTAVYSSMSNGDIDRVIHEFWNQSALVNSTQSALHSKRGADIAVNGVSTAIAAYSMLNTILKHGWGGALSTFGIGDFGWFRTTTQSTTTHDFTIASETHATGNIELYARTGDINIRHRIAEAVGDQTYTAAGSIFVAPGYDRTETTQTTQSSSVGFNVFTMDAHASYSGGRGHSRTTHYDPSQFKSGGINTFRAGKGISIMIPQIEGESNVFDAMIVNLENKPDEQETDSETYGVGLATNVAQMAGATASLNVGASKSRDTSLNDAYIRGAVDFMHSQVKNQGCCVMDITNQGASYQYIPGQEVHKSHNFAIAVSGLDLSSPDAFAYSLGRSLASSAASMGAGMLASKAGLGGFVSSMAAMIAGAQVNSEIMPQISDETHAPTGLGTTGSIEFEQNSEGFKALGVDLRPHAFNAFVEKLRTDIFDECLDKNVTPEETVERIEVLEEYVEERYGEEREKEASHEEAIAKIEKDLPVAKEIVKLDQEIRKDGAPTTLKVADLRTQSSIDADAVSLSLNTWLRQDSDDVRIQAAKIIVLVKAADFSQDRTQAKLSVYQKTMNKLKDVSASALNGLGTILGAPQQAEAVLPAVPAIVVTVVEATQGLMLFLAANPDFPQKVTAQILSLITISNMLEKGRREGIHRVSVLKARESAHAKTKERASGRGGSGGGGSSMEPENQDHEKKKDKNLHFGRDSNQDYHTFRHVQRETNLQRSQVEDAIKNDLKSNIDKLSSEKTYKGEIEVGGVKLEYHAHEFLEGEVNIGRITVIK